jgi:hypothetical protein
MTNSTKTSPADAVLDVFSYVDEIAKQRSISDEHLVAALVAGGTDRAIAERLRAFVPEAFAWALLRQMGATRFSDHFYVLDAASTRKKYPIAVEQHFLAALTIATTLLADGWTNRCTRETFESVVERSAAIGAANQVLEKKLSLADAEIGPFVVWGLV